MTAGAPAEQSTELQISAQEDGTCCLSISDVSITPSAVARSGVLRALLADFEGQHSKTTLPLYQSALSAWEHFDRTAKHSPQVLCDVIQVAAFLQDAQTSMDACMGLLRCLYGALRPQGTTVPMDSFGNPRPHDTPVPLPWHVASDFTDGFRKLPDAEAQQLAAFLSPDDVINAPDAVMQAWLHHHVATGTLPFPSHDWGGDRSVRRQALRRFLRAAATFPFQTVQLPLVYKSLHCQACTEAESPKPRSPAESDADGGGVGDGDCPMLLSVTTLLGLDTSWVALNEPDSQFILAALPNVSTLQCSWSLYSNQVHAENPHCKSELLTAASLSALRSLDMHAVRAHEGHFSQIMNAVQEWYALTRLELPASQLSSDCKGGAVVPAVGGLTNLRHLRLQAASRYDILGATLRALSTVAPLTMLTALLLDVTVGAPSAGRYGWRVGMQVDVLDLLCAVSKWTAGLPCLRVLHHAITYEGTDKVWLNLDTRMLTECSPSMRASLIKGLAALDDVRMTWEGDSWLMHALQDLDFGPCSLSLRVQLDSMIACARRPAFLESLEGLSRLSRLTSLEYQFIDWQFLPASYLNSFRCALASMPDLRELSLGSMSKQYLWTQRLRPEDVQPTSGPCEDSILTLMPEICAMSGLRVLRLWCGSCEAEVIPSQPCVLPSTLSRLEIRTHHVLGAQGSPQLPRCCTLLERPPQLRELSIDGGTKCLAENSVPDLQFLSRLDQLHALRLWLNGSVVPECIAAVANLKSLTKLIVFCNDRFSLVGGADALAVAQQVRFMPALRCLMFCPWPQPHSVDLLNDLKAQAPWLRVVPDDEEVLGYVNL